MDTHIVSQLPSLDIARSFAAMAGQPYSLWLDSSSDLNEDARYSFACANPSKIVRLDAVKRNAFDDVRKAFDEVRKALGEKRGHIDGLPPFQGGAAGLFAYDLVRGLEKLPKITKKADNCPDLAIGIYNQVLSFDRKKNCGWLITRGDKQKHEQFLKRFVDGAVDLPSPPPKIELSPTLPRDEYEARISKVINHILEGDIFQANLSQRFVGKAESSSFAHYCALRARNPAPFSGYFSLGGGLAIASSSPERFLMASAAGNVKTCPIKGTLPVEEDPKLLLESEKDRAENIMIVDLLRNDLSRVCKYDSVKVKSLCKLKTFARVHHMVSTIVGELQDDKDALDLLAACFAGGSITGAPKVRAMEIIQTLEDSKRGAYCGSLGYIGFDGCMDTNILIRTLTFDGENVSLRTGGGIVLDSDPKAEYQETLHKARGMV